MYILKIYIYQLLSNTLQVTTDYRRPLCKGFIKVHHLSLATHKNERRIHTRAQTVTVTNNHFYKGRDEIGPRSSSWTNHEVFTAFCLHRVTTGGQVVTESQSGSDRIVASKRLHFCERPYWSAALQFSN